MLHKFFYISTQLSESASVVNRTIAKIHSKIEFHNLLLYCNKLYRIDRYKKLTKKASVAIINL